MHLEREQGQASLQPPAFVVHLVLAAVLPVYAESVSEGPC